MTGLNQRQEGRKGLQYERACITLSPMKQIHGLLNWNGGSKRELRLAHLKYMPDDIFVPRRSSNAWKNGQARERKNAAT